MIAMAAVLAVLLVILVVVICNAMFRRRQGRNPYQNQSKNVIVKNGVDVRKQMPGGEKGEVFTGNLGVEGTCYVNPSVKTWRIAFDNLNTGERIYKDFSEKMWIGRTEPAQGEPVKLTVPGDGNVSRNHCMIRESGDRLCLQDMNSSNHTYLNGTVVMNAVYLQNGDIIQVGGTQFRVQYSIIGNRPT